jgi:hypothetical protein
MTNSGFPAPGAQASELPKAEVPPYSENASSAADDLLASRSTSIENSVEQARWILVPLFTLWVASFAVAAVLA